MPPAESSHNRSVIDANFQVPQGLEYTATLAWATSGAVVGIRKEFDLTGVFVVALLSASGGGLIRDAVFLQRTPVLLVNPIYLILIGGTTLLMAMFTVPLTRLLRDETFSKLVDLIDAIGTPAFAVIGMQLALDRQLPIIAVIFIGVANGVAGGLLRDIVVRDVPSLLRPGQFVSLALVIVCGFFIALRHYSHLSPTEAGWATVAAFVFIRVTAVRFNWRTRSIAERGATLGIVHDSDSDREPADR